MGDTPQTPPRLGGLRPPRPPRPLASSVSAHGSSVPMLMGASLTSAMNPSFPAMYPDNCVRGGRAADSSNRLFHDAFGPLSGLPTTGRASPLSLTAAVRESLRVP